MTDLHDLLTRNDKREGLYDGFEDWFYHNKKREDSMKAFWIIFVEHTDGGRHYRHSSLESALKEAERLAGLPANQGLRVYVFECVGRCKTEATPVTWEFPF